MNENLTISSSMGGQFTISRSGEDKIVRQIAVPAAQAGTIHSNTGGSAVITMEVGHGITGANTVGVFWDGGQRIDCDVTANGSTTITIDTTSGEGDAIPIPAIADDTAVTVGLQVQRTDIAFAAAGMQMLTIGCDAKASGAFQIGVNFTDDADESLLAVKVAGGECYPWADSTGPANPITGTVAKLNCYNGALEATTIRVGILLS